MAKIVDTFRTRELYFLGLDVEGLTMPEMVEWCETVFEEYPNLPTVTIFTDRGSYAGSYAGEGGLVLNTFRCDVCGQFPDTCTC